MMKPNYLRSMACVVVLALFGCGQGTDSSADTALAASAAQVVMQNEFAQNLPADAPTLYVTTDATYPPFEFWDEYGNITGFDIDLINAIAADQGMKVEMRHVVWRDVFRGIENAGSESNQLVLGSLEATPERSVKYELSDIYAESFVSLVVLEESPIQSLADVSGKKIALLDGSTVQEKLTQAKAVDFEVVGSMSTYLSFKKMVNREVDAAADDKFTMQYHMANHPEFKVRMIEIPSDSKRMAFATNKGNTALITKINRGLANIRANGTYDKIIRKWFGEQATIRTATAAASQPQKTQ